MIDPKNLRDVLAVMRDYGASYLKTNDLEVKLSESIEVPKTTRSFNQPEDKVPFPTIEQTLTQEEESKIKHKVVELTSVMKLSDMDLVDSLFPDHTDQQDEGEAS